MIIPLEVAVQPQASVTIIIKGKTTSGQTLSDQVRLIVMPNGDPGLLQSTHPSSATPAPQSP